MRISDWSSDVCSPDLALRERDHLGSGTQDPRADGGEEVELQLGGSRPRATRDEGVEDSAEDVIGERSEGAAVGGAERVEELGADVELRGHGAGSDLDGADGEVVGDAAHLAGRGRHQFGNGGVEGLEGGSRRGGVGHAAVYRWGWPRRTSLPSSSRR